MVPTRFIAESFGETVNWDGDTRTISIYEGGSSPISSSPTPTSSPRQAKISVPIGSGGLPTNTSGLSDEDAMNLSADDVPTSYYQDKVNAVANSIQISDGMVTGDLPDLGGRFFYMATYKNKEIFNTARNPQDSFSVPTDETGKVIIILRDKQARGGRTSGVIVDVATGAMINLLLF